MAKKYGSKVLEWVSELVEADASATNQRVVINLNLDDDELAEIRMIESEISLTTPAAIVDDQVTTQHALSMDPSVSIADNPYAEGTYEDLETLYTFRREYSVDANATAGSVDQKIEDVTMKQVVFPDAYPLLIATNLGFLIDGDAGLATQHCIRIWFTRRKAVGNELARTLLKRR